MNATDTTYLDVASDIATNGHHKEDRTGTGTMSVFGKQMKFSLMAGTLPLLTTKELKLRSIIHELIWFLRGEGNIAYLKENKVGIWDAWSDENGDLGPVYGVQWRHWNDIRVIPADDWPRYEARGFKESFRDPITGMMAIEREIDQIAELIHQLKTNPDSRRLIISAWNPAVLEEQALPPCHSFVQFYTFELNSAWRLSIASKRIENKIVSGQPLSVNETILRETLLAGRKVTDEVLGRVMKARRGLSCQLYQRSGDFFLGVPFNIASYSLLTHMIAKCVGMEPIEFVHTIGDAHLYSNHMDQIDEQSGRAGFETDAFVELLGEATDPGDFRFEDIIVHGYQHESAIKAPIAV